MANLGSLHFSAGIKPDYSGLDELEKRLNSLKGTYKLDISLGDLESRIESIGKSLRALQVAHGATFNLDGLDKADRQAAQFAERNTKRFESLGRAVYEAGKHGDRFKFPNLKYSLEELDRLAVALEGIKGSGDRAAAFEAVKKGLSGVVPELERAISRMKEMQVIIGEPADNHRTFFGKRILEAKKSIEEYNRLFAGLEANRGNAGAFDDMFGKFSNSDAAHYLDKLRKELQWFTDHTDMDFSLDSKTVKLAIPEAVIERVYVKQILFDRNAGTDLTQRISKMIEPVAVTFVPVIDNDSIDRLLSNISVSVKTRLVTDESPISAERKPQETRKTIGNAKDYFNIDSATTSAEAIAIMQDKIAEAIPKVNLLRESLKSLSGTDAEGLEKKGFEIISSITSITSELDEKSKLGTIQNKVRKVGVEIQKFIEDAENMTSAASIPVSGTAGDAADAIKKQVDEEKAQVEEEKKLAELRRKIQSDLVIKEPALATVAGYGADKLASMTSSKNAVSVIDSLKKQVLQMVDDVRSLDIKDANIVEMLFGDKKGSISGMSARITAMLDAVSKSLESVKKTKDASIDTTDLKAINGRGLSEDVFVGFSDIIGKIVREIGVFVSRVEAVKATLSGMQSFQLGGRFYGAGTGTSDENTVRISDKEFIVTAKAIASPIGAIAQLANAMAGGRAEASALISALNTFRMLRPDVGAFIDGMQEIAINGQLTKKTIRELNRVFAEMSDVKNFMSVGDMERYNAALQKLVDTQMRLDEAIGRQKGDAVIKPLSKEADDAREEFKKVLAEVKVEPQVTVEVKPENVKVTGNKKAVIEPIEDMMDGMEEEVSMKGENRHLYTEFNRLMVDLIAKRDILNAKGKNTDNISEIIRRYSQWLEILLKADTAMQRLVNEEKRHEEIINEGGNITIADQDNIDTLREQAEWAQKIYDLNKNVTDSFRRYSRQATGWDSVSDIQDSAAAKEMAMLKRNNDAIAAQEQKLLEQEQKKAEEVRRANEKLKGWINNLNMAVDNMGKDAMSKFAKGDKTDQALRMLTDLRDRMKNVLDKYLAGIVSSDNLLRFVDKAKNTAVFANTKREASYLREEQRKANAPAIREEINVFNDLDAAIKSARDRLVQLYRDLGNREGKGQDTSLIRRRISNLETNELKPLIEAKESKNIDEARRAIKAYNDQKLESSRLTSEALSAQNDYNRSVRKEEQERQKAFGQTTDKIRGEIANLEILKKSYSDIKSVVGDRVISIDLSKSRNEIAKTIDMLRDMLNTSDAKALNDMWSNYVNSKVGVNSRREASRLAKEEGQMASHVTIPAIREKRKAYENLRKYIDEVEKEIGRLERMSSRNISLNLDTSLIARRISELSGIGETLKAAYGSGTVADATEAISAYRKNRVRMNNETAEAIELQRQLNKEEAGRSRADEKAVGVSQKIKGEIDRLTLLSNSYSDVVRNINGTPVVIDMSASRAEIYATINSLIKMRALSRDKKVSAWNEYVNTKTGANTRSRAEELYRQKEDEANATVIPAIKERQKAYKELGVVIKEVNDKIDSLLTRIATNKVSGFDTSVLESRVAALQSSVLAPLVAVSNNPGATASQINEVVKRYRDAVSELNRETRVAIRLQNEMNKPPKAVKTDDKARNGIKKEIDSLNILMQKYQDYEKTVNGRKVVVDLSKPRQEIASVISMLEQMSRLSGKDLNAQWTKFVQQGIAPNAKAKASALAEGARRTAMEMEKARKTSEDFSRNIQNLGGEIKTLGRLGGELGMIFQNAFSIYALRNFAQSIIRVGGEIQKQRIAMGSILQDEYKADTIYSQMKALAVRSPFGISDLNTFSKQLSAYSIPYNELYDTMKRLADISAGVGVDMGRIVLAFGQIRAAKFLRGQELRQLTEANIPILDKLVANFSAREGRVVGAGEVIDMISKKMVSFEDVKQALWEMTEAGGVFYNMQEQMADSLAVKWKNLGDAIELIYADIADSSVGSFLKGIAEVVTEIARKWKYVGSALGTVTTLLTLQKITMFAMNKYIGNMTDSFKKQVLEDKQKAAQVLRTASVYRTLTQEEKNFLKTSRRITAEDIVILNSKNRLRLDELNKRKMMEGALSAELEAERESLVKESSKTKELAAQLYLRGQLNKEELRSIRGKVGMTKNEYDVLVGNAKKKGNPKWASGRWDILVRKFNPWFNYSDDILKQYSEVYNAARRNEARGRASEFEKNLLKRGFSNQYMGGVDPLFFRQYAAYNGISFRELQKMLKNKMIDFAQFRAASMEIGVNTSDIARAQVLIKKSMSDAREGTSATTRALSGWSIGFNNASRSLGLFFRSVGSGFASIGRTIASTFLSPFALVTAAVEAGVLVWQYYAEQAAEAMRIQEETIKRGQEGYAQLNDAAKIYKPGVSATMTEGELSSAIDDLKNKLKDYDPEWQNTFKIAFDVSDEGEYLMSAADRYELLVKRLNEVKEAYKDTSDVAVAARLSNKATDDTGLDDMLDENLKDLQDEYKKLDEFAMQTAKHMNVLGDIINTVADNNGDFKKSVLAKTLGRIPTPQEMSKSLGEYKITPTVILDIAKDYPRVIGQINYEIKKGLNTTNTALHKSLSDADMAFQNWRSQILNGVKDAEKEALKDAENFAAEYERILKGSSPGGVIDQTKARLGIQTFLDENSITDERVKKFFYAILEDRAIIAKVDVEFNEKDGQDFNNFQKVLRDAFKRNPIDMGDMFAGLDLTDVSAKSTYAINRANDSIKRLIASGNDIPKFYKNMDKAISDASKQLDNFKPAMERYTALVATLGYENVDWTDKVNASLREQAQLYGVILGYLNTMRVINAESRGGLSDWQSNIKKVLDSQFSERFKDTIIDDAYNTILKSFGETKDENGKEIYGGNSIFTTIEAVRSLYSTIKNQLANIVDKDNPVTQIEVASKERLLEYLKAVAAAGNFRLEDDNKGGRGTKDLLYIQLNNQLKAVKEMYEWYEKFRASMNKTKEDAQRTVRNSDFYKARMNELEQFAKVEGVDTGIDLSKEDFFDEEGYKTVLDNMKKKAYELIRSASEETRENRQNLYQDICKLLGLEMPYDELKRSVDKMTNDAQKAIERASNDWNFFRNVLDETGDISMAMNLSFDEVTASENLSKGIDSFAEWLRAELTKRLRAISDEISGSEELSGLENKLLDNLANFISDADWSKYYDMDDDALSEYFGTATALVKPFLKAINDAMKSTIQKDKETVFDILKTFNDPVSKAKKAKQKFNKIKEAILDSTIGAAEKQRLLNIATAQYNDELLKLDSRYTRLFSNIYAVTKSEADEIGKLIKENLDEKLKSGTITATEYAEEIQKISDKLEEVQNRGNAFTSVFKGGLSGVADYMKQSGNGMMQMGASNLQDALKSGSKDSKAASEAMMEAGENMMASAQGMANTLAIIDAIVHGIDDFVQGMKGTVDEIVEMREALGYDTSPNSRSGKRQAFWSTFADASSNAASGWDSLKSGNIMGAVKGVIGSWTSWFTGAAKAFDSRLSQEIEESQKRADEFKKTVDMVSEAFENLGQNATLAFSRMRQNFLLFEKQMAGLNSEISEPKKAAMNLYLNGDGDMWSSFDVNLETYTQKAEKKAKKAGLSISEAVALNVGSSFAGFAVGGGYGAVVGGLATLPNLFKSFGSVRAKRQLEKYQGYIYATVEAIETLNRAKIDDKTFERSTDLGKQYLAQYESLVYQRMEVQKQLAAEEAKKNTDKEAVSDYQDQILELNTQIQDFLTNMYKELYGLDLSTWAEEIGNALVEAFKTGEDAVASFKNSVNDMLADIATKVLNQYINTKWIQPLMNELFGEDGQGGKVNFESGNPQEDMETILAYLAEWRDSNAEDIAKFGKEYLDKADKMTGGALSEENTDTASNSIKGITEETADILAAYINGMRLDLSVQRSVVEKIYELMLAKSGLTLEDGEYVPFEELESSSSIIPQEMLESIKEPMIYNNLLMESIALEQLPTFNAIAESQLAQLNMIAESTRIGAEYAQICAAYAEETHALLSDVSTGIKKFAIQ